MTFRHPWFLAGLAVAALPLLLHVLRTRRVKRIDFSTLELLKLLHRQHSIRLRITQLLLMLVRVAAAIAVVMLFAQPVFTARTLTWLNLEGPRTFLILLDDSGSMQATLPGGETLFERARNEVVRVVGDLTERDRVTLLTLAPRARVLWQGAPGDFQPGGLPGKPSGCVADLTGAAQKAREFLEENAGRRSHIILVSDLCDDARPILKAVPPNIVRVAPIRPRSQEALGNWRLEPLHGPRGALAIGEVATFTTRAWGADEGLTGVVSFEVDDSVVDRRTLTSADGAQRGPAGELTFAHSFNQAGRHVVRARLGDDSLPGDNLALTTVEVVDRRRIVLVGGGGSGPPRPGESGFYLRNASPEAEIRATLGDEGLDGVHLLILTGGTELTPSEGTAVADFLRRGGPVLLLVGGDSNVEAWNRSLLRPLGVGTLGRRLSGQGVQPWRASTAGRPASSLGSRVPPELWAAVASTSYFLFEPGAAFARADVLARFPDETPAVADVPVGEGHLILVNAGSEGEDSELPLHPVFPILVHEAGRLSGRAPAHHRAGDAIAFRLEMDDYNTVLSVETPDAGVVTLNPVRQGESLVATLTETLRAGLYRVRWAREGQEVRRDDLVVDWPGEESTLAFPSDEELKGLYPGVQFLREAKDRPEAVGGGGISLSDALLSLVVILILCEAYLVMDLEHRTRLSAGVSASRSSRPNR